MIFDFYKNVLFISPHTDDCEFGFGATIPKIVASGSKVTWVICCNAVESLPKNFDHDTLIDEQIESAKRLGLSPEQLIFWDFPVRRFPENRQDILEALVALGAKSNFDAVFCPSGNDWHQDHMTISQEVRRAFKRISIFGYDLPWNNFSIDHSLIVPVTQEDLELKMHALAAFDSQKSRPYMDATLIHSIARVRAIALDAEFAEAFEVIRMVGA